jgi:hypothetical protein
MLYEKTAISRKFDHLARKELDALRNEDRVSLDLIFRGSTRTTGYMGFLVASALENFHILFRARQPVATPSKHKPTRPAANAEASSRCL